MPSIIETFDLIDTFSKLPKGWNFGEGVPAASVSLEQSRELLRIAYILGHKEADAFPGIDGEVQVCFYVEDDTLEITTEINGTLTVTVEKGDETSLFKEKVSLTEVIKILKDFTYNQCRSYVSSISTNITIAKRRDYPVWRSDPHHQMAASPSSIKIVPKRQAEQFATTQNDIILQLPEILSYFGKSQTV